MRMWRGTGVAAQAVLLVALVCASAGTARAVPSLQLGPGSTGGWSYDVGTQTWVATDNPFELQALANDTAANGGNGAYAWDSAGAGTQTAYLVVGAIPMINFDGFDILIENDGGALTLVSSGFGAPPVSDPNDLAPHGIFNTFFEVYEFNFDGASTTILDTQPGQAGTGAGFIETFDITLNSLAPVVNGVHFDLFTVQGDGILGSNMVNRFAPFSHDAELAVPESSTLLLLGSSLFGLAGWRWRKDRVATS